MLVEFPPAEIGVKLTILMLKRKRRLAMNVFEKILDLDYRVSLAIVGLIGGLLFGFR